MGTATLNTRFATATATAAAIAVLSMATDLRAQTSRPALDPATAQAMRDHCLGRARDAGHAVSIAIFDQAGNLVSFTNDGSSPAAAEVARWKGRSAATYRNATVDTATWNVPTAPMISTAEGGVPLFTREGAALGGIGVSGAPSEFDAECGTRAAEASGLRASRP